MIESITIENFRAFAQPRVIRLKGGSLLLFAENGKGKSSFVHAIEYAIRKDKKSAIKKHGGKRVTNKHIRHIHSKSPPEVAIMMRDGSSIVNGRKNENKRKKGSGKKTQAEVLYEIVNDQRNVLRRRDILRVIDTSPGGRYKILEPFISSSKHISDHENATNAIKQTKETLEISFNKIKSSIEQNKKKIQLSFDIPLYDRKTVIKKLEQDYKRITGKKMKLSQDSGLPTLEQFDKFQSLTHEEGKNVNKLEEGLSHFLEIPEFREKIIKQLKIYVEKVEELRDEKKKIAVGELRLKRILSESSKLFEEDEFEKCPVCDHDIIFSELKEAINRRISVFKSVTSIERKTDCLNKQIQKDTDNLLKKMKMIGGINLKEESLRKKYPTFTNFEKRVKKTKKLVDDIQQESDAYTNKKDYDESNLQELKRIVENMFSDVFTDDFEKDIGESNEIVKKERDRILSNKPILGLYSKAKTLSENVPIIDESEKEKELLLHAVSLADLWMTTLADTKKDHIENVLKETSKDLRYFYNLLYKENSDLKLVIKREKGENSIDIDASFYDEKNQDPRAFFSESRLDAIGICLFFALYRRNIKIKGYGPCTIILDDIITSFDNQHRLYIIKLLLEEFSKEQLIITTHDRRWYSLFLSRIRGISRFTHTEISEWNVKEGPLILQSPPKDDMERLGNLLRDGHSNRKVIAGTAGIVLEYLLGEIRYGFSLSIKPKRDEKYTIGDLWPKFFKVCTNEKSDQTFPEKVQDIVKALDYHKCIRNEIGAHSKKKEDDDISREEAKEYGTLVMNLYACFICSECGKVVEAKGNNNMACRCQKLSYTNVKV